MSFSKNSPLAGQQIKSVHIRNIEDWIYPMMYITLTNGNTITGVVKLLAGNNIVLTGDATNGVTVAITGTLGTTSLSGLITDTNVSGGVNGDLLIKSNGMWTNIPSGSLITASTPSALIFPAIYTNAYVGMIDEIMLSTSYDMTGSYVKVTTAPTTGNIKLNLYKNGTSIITGITLTGNTVDTPFATGLVKGDILKYEVTEINTTYSVGNAMFLGIY